ncbi:WD domain, g-beta repeat domain-containing protein [Ditylenchus destructor]|nr:WD domain, g-beta repeat domain-containing protein [Ditylenchus destructor]
MKAERILSKEHSSLVVTSRIWGVNWNHSGRVLASCGDDKAVKVWEYAEANDEKGVNASLTCLNTISGDQRRTIRYITFSPCGTYLASASFDGSIIIYEYRDGDFDEAHKLEGHENEVKCCEFSVSGEFLATCSRDKTVWVWQVDEDNDYEVGSILQNHSADVKFVVWHPNEDILVSGGYDCSIRFYAFDGDDWVTQHAIPDAHDNTVWSASFDGSGEYLCTCGADSAVKIWKRNRQNSSNSEPGWLKEVDFPILDTRWPLYSVSWNHQNGLIAVGGGDCLIRFFSFDNENAALSLLCAIRLDAEINCLKWNPVFKNIVGAACDDGTVNIIEVVDNN